MAIGRISGPMLFANLERQGLDLAIDGNLIYFDVNNRRIGVNTDAPQYDVHIEGWDGRPAEFVVNGSITANTITVANAYTLPTIGGTVNSFLASDGANGTYWSSLTASVERKKFNYTIDDLPAGESREFNIDIGIASIVYALTVSRPCMIEVFSTSTKDETNPYTFLATLDHLTDDGTVLLDDGSVIQQRQYSIFANQEEPPRGTVYARITNVDGTAGPVTLNLTYFLAVTDNQSGSYNVNVVQTLPDTGYTGQTVLLESTGKIYAYYNNTWNPTS